MQAEGNSNLSLIHQFIYMCKICTLNLSFQKHQKKNNSLSDTSKLSGLIKRKFENKTAKSY